MEITYKELLARIKAKVPEIKFIDLDRGQLDNPEGNYTYDKPALFISFGNIFWNTIGEKVENGNGELTFRIAIANYHDANNHTPTETLDNAMDDLAIRKKVCKALNGFLGTNFNELQHVNTNQEPRDDGLLVFAETYSTLMVDNSAVAETVPVEPVTLSLQVNS